MADISDKDFVILCGGLGKRLRSVIGENQKVMAEIDEEPFLNFLIRFIAGQGGQRFILCTGYKSELVEAYYEQNDLGVEIVISKEDQPLGTGGAIKHACQFVRSDPFFALNGDSLVPVDYRKLNDFFEEKKAKAVLVTQAVTESKDCGVITVDDAGQITSFREKVKVSAEDGPLYISTGAYCFDKGIFDVMPQEDVFSIEEDFFPAIAGKSCFSYEIKDEFLDIGIPDRFKKAQEKFKRN